MVRKVSSGDGQGRYELKGHGPEDHHHHLICTRCGKIVNYQDFLQEELELVKKTDHNIEFLGLCEKCR
jgi:Fur family ferric uptake transcriptional regulator